MSSSETRVRRALMSRWNVGILAVLLVLTVAAAVRHVWPVAVVLAAGCVAGIVLPLSARAVPSGDLGRVNALEFKDERDRAIAVQAFAVVGVAAMAASFLFLIVSAIIDYAAFGESPLTLPVAGTLVLLTVVWSASTWFFARR